jgi:hypothetical protein
MPDSPRRLIRNSTAEFLIFTTQAGGQSIEARFEDQTVWLTQKLMAELFQVDVRTVSEHLGNIYMSEELDRNRTIRKFRIVRREGSRDVQRDVDHYDLDAIISVGYRVNSLRATQFRQWATRVLREFAIKGWVLDRRRTRPRQGGRQQASHGSQELGAVTRRENRPGRRRGGQELPLQERAG